MSGWIKFEKDLATDPRVLRMAKALDRMFFMFEPGNADNAQYDPCNATALPGVTLVCGALVRLWIYADSHCREDNTLDLGAKEINELLCIPNFCSIMPEDWLIEIDENTVELPGFQEHNGVEAKKKALTQKRVSRHRDKQKLPSVTACNADALPDQDQTKTRLDHKELRADARRNEVSESEPERKPRGHSRATQLPEDFQLDEDLAAYAISRLPGVIVSELFENFRNYHTAQGTTMKRWDAAWRTWVGNAPRLGYPGQPNRRFQQPEPPRRTREFQG